MVKKSNIRKLWNKATQVIPNGVMLYSKRPDLFLDYGWPTFYKKAKDCYIWDLNNKKYTDLSFMGVGTNVLGYSNNEINKAVINAINNSNMSTLNNFEETILAEKLIEIHPWSSMVKYARTGGEANCIAIRIARASSGKNNVAFCGYHGWHDWFLSSNLQNSRNLDNHLMTGIPIFGVNTKLRNTCFPFKFNNIASFKKVCENNNIGTVIMEVKRDVEPDIKFLKFVRNFTKKKGIVLIFDECTSGFREFYGGLHLKYKVYPDIAVFGKAIGNGFAINPIIGSKEVMENASKTFISSTFWTEKIGVSAALATIKSMKKIKSWETITSLGNEIKSNWLKIAKDNQLPINIIGLESIPKFYIKSKKWSKVKKFIAKKFIEQQMLSSNTIYVSVAHDKTVMKKYFDNLNEIFFKIRRVL